VCYNVQGARLLSLNKPEREEWFTNLGFGMFIHWSFDVQFGLVISHSMVGASGDALEIGRRMNKTKAKKAA